MNSTAGMVLVVPIRNSKKPVDEIEIRIDGTEPGEAGQTISILGLRPVSHDRVEECVGEISEEHLTRWQDLLQQSCE